ncbi:aminoacyl-tRNA hydrolase [bacterium]|nr:MAG: aminoacyl-tRNA hydrolase [bacterium]
MTPLWIIVGLGNPGPEYRGTRHNVGFDVIDLLAQKHKIKLDRSKHKAKYGLGMIDGTPVLLVKPLTFMNLSGQAVAPFLREHGVKPDRLLVVADDLDLVLGRVRIKPKGSAGGHNGHRSIIALVGTEDYPRLKIGIGSVDKSKTIHHVLGSFKPDERVVAKEAIDISIDAIERIVGTSLEHGMELVNPRGT